MEQLVVSENKIENMIYVVREKQVMLDSDLAKLYQCKNGTKSINLAVKRHINSFPERFMFQLTEEETKNIYSRFQIETLNRNKQKQGLNIKYLPYVFTEQGVAMLATVLRTDVAEKVSIAIMDDYDKKFEVVFDKLENNTNFYLFFKGNYMMLILCY